MRLPDAMRNVGTFGPGRRSQLGHTLGGQGNVTTSVTSLRILTREQCLALLPTVPVGRVGVSIDALPVILPVNFLLVDNWILFRTVPGTKLDAAMIRSVVAFQADEHAPDGSWGWSVLVRGYAHDLKDGISIAAAALLRAWAFPHGEANHVVGIETTMVSGRRFGALPAPSSRLEDNGPGTA